jgi:hypothetical protein
MSITYEVDSEREMVLVVATGPLTLDDMLDIRHRIAQDPACPRHYDRLIDLRGVSKFPNKLELSMLAERMIRDPGSPGARRAFVADSDAVYGTFRMLEQLARESQEKWRTFRSIEEAELWLTSADSDDDA